MKPKKRTKYVGEPFPETAFAEMESDGDEGQYVSFSDATVADVTSTDHPKWIAKYRLVSVRKLKKRVRVDAIEVR